MATESPTLKIDAVSIEAITERPKPYIPRIPPEPEVIYCPSCGHRLDPVRGKDAGWLKPIAGQGGFEDGEDILAYVCINLACLDGLLDH